MPEEDENMEEGGARSVTLLLIRIRKHNCGDGDQKEGSRMFNHLTDAGNNPKYPETAHK